MRKTFRVCECKFKAFSGIVQIVCGFFCRIILIIAFLKTFFVKITYMVVTIGKKSYICGKFVHMACP